MAREKVCKIWDVYTGKLVTDLALDGPSGGLEFRLGRYVVCSLRDIPLFKFSSECTRFSSRGQQGHSMLITLLNQADGRSSVSYVALW